MLAYASLIADAAVAAGMKVPPDPDGDFDPSEFPHFSVFCIVQLCRAMSSSSEHWSNAKVVAGVSDSEIMSITINQLIARGLQYPDELTRRVVHSDLP